MIRAPPVRIQPVPAKLSALSPGASAYRLLSPIDKNGWISAGATHAEVLVADDRPPVATANLLAAIAGPAAAPAPRMRITPLRPAILANRRKRNCFIAYTPSMVSTGSRAISPAARPLALRPWLTPGLPFSAVGFWPDDRPPPPILNAPWPLVDTCPRLSAPRTALFPKHGLRPAEEDPGRYIVNCPLRRSRPSRPRGYTNTSPQTRTSMNARLGSATYAALVLARTRGRSNTVNRPTFTAVCADRRERLRASVRASREHRGERTPPVGARFHDSGLRV